MTGHSNRIFEFGPFRLDPRERLLLREGRPVTLRAKLFDTLVALVEHSGSLVDKSELLKRVWSDAVVEEGNLAHNISVLRKVLGDRATGSKYIETVPGKGYRFVAKAREVRRGEGTPLLESRLAGARPVAADIVQRQKELVELHRSFDRALGGRRQVVFITGEAGIGKTTLVDAFVAEVQSKTAPWYGRGECVEHRGEGEAYMPILEALGRICRGAGGAELIAFLARCAPAWLAQMPWLLTDDELGALQHKMLGATRERMLREMVEAVETLTVGKPLVLVLEDLHWSDCSTLDLVEWLARRQEPARLLVIGTHRPGDLRQHGHALPGLVQELRVRGLCDELPLGLLEEAAVAEYLAARFEGVDPPPGLAQILHRRTEGNPLFMRNVVEHWVSRELLAMSDGVWTARAPLEELGKCVPDTLRRLIEQQLELVTAEELAILEAASVAGREFPVATVAAAVECTDEEAEVRCDGLSKKSQFLELRGSAEWPDGSVSASYGFLHDLHREVLYSRVPAGRKARFHSRIGARLEAGYGARAAVIAATLAVHFVRGRDGERAVRYLLEAAGQALARSAHREAVGHLDTALDVLERSPDSAERAAQEIAVRAMLAPALIATRGFGAPEAEHAYTRALALCEEVDDAPQQPAVLVGLATLWEVRGQYRESQRLMEERLRQGREEELLVESHELLACSLFHQGGFAQALDHANQGLELYDAGRSYAFMASYGDNPAVACHSWAALSLWFLGDAEGAMEKVRQALVVARDHSYSLASAQVQAAVLHQLRGEPEQVLEMASAALAVAAELGFPFRAAMGKVLRGWGLAMTGRHEAGIEEIGEGLSRCRAAGAEMDRPYFLALLAEAHATAGRPEESLQALAEAIGMVRRSRAFFYEAELHRLWGCMLVQAGTRCLNEVEAALLQAVGVARRQKAQGLEVRAAASLRRFWQRHGKRADASEASSESRERLVISAAGR